MPEYNSNMLPSEVAELAKAVQARNANFENVANRAVSDLAEQQRQQYNTEFGGPDPYLTKAVLGNPTVSNKFVWSAYSQMQESLERLYAEIEMLETDLSRILGPEEVRPGQSQDQSPVRVHSELANYIEVDAGRLIRAIERLRNIRERVEV